jgi:hypothetical protein
MVSTREKCIQWGTPRAAFKLSSPETEIVDRAGTFLRHWPAPSESKPRAHWRIAPSTTAMDSREMRWRVENSAGFVCESKSVDAAVMMVESLTTQWFVEDAARTTLLHAALLARDGAGIAILGRQFSGKSTLACALWQHGWSLLGDDTLVVESGENAILAQSTPRRVSMRHPSRALLGEKLWSQILAAPSCQPTADGYLFAPQDIALVSASQTVPLRAIFFLARRDVSIGPAATDRLHHAQALLALMPYSNLLKSLGVSSALRRLQPLADAVPVFDLGRDEPNRMIRAVERVVVTLSAPSCRSTLSFS